LLRVYDRNTNGSAVSAWERSGGTAAQRLDELRHQVAPVGAVGFAVGGDHELVDAPGRLDLDVLVGGEQVAQNRIAKYVRYP